MLFTFFFIESYFIKTALCKSLFPWQIVKQSCPAIPLPMEHKGRSHPGALHRIFVRRTLENSAQYAQRKYPSLLCGTCLTTVSGLPWSQVPTNTRINSVLKSKAVVLPVISNCRE